LMIPENKAVSKFVFLRKVLRWEEPP
jgi:hypothetical protein